MKFYDTGNAHDSLGHYVNALLGFAETNNTDYTLAAKARATNTAKYMLALKLWRANDMWSYDDNANTDLPIFTTTLVAGQRDYTLPTTALGIERAEIKDAGGNYIRLSPMDETDRASALTNYGESSGTPSKYWIKGRSLFVDPAPATGSVTMASGLKLYLQREVNEFTAATTTTEVGFEEPGDRVIAFMVAEEYAGRFNMDAQLQYIKFKLYGGMVNNKPVDGLLDVVLQQAANRVKDMKPRFRISVEDME